MYIERTATYFYQDIGNNQRLRHESVWFVPDITLGCVPPYERGKKDTMWIKYNPKRQTINVNDKKQCERLIGLLLMAF